MNIPSATVLSADTLQPFRSLLQSGIEKAVNKFLIFHGTSKDDKDVDPFKCAKDCLSTGLL